jgi:hypothetical protein
MTENFEYEYRQSEENVGRDNIGHAWLGWVFLVWDNFKMIF